MLVEQDSRCAICREKKPSRICVDHDHVTGRVRGLLCQHCNWYVGLLDRNSEVLVRLSVYGKGPLEYRKTYNIWGGIDCQSDKL